MSESQLIEAHPLTELRPGAHVEVRNRFDGSWAAGFEIAEATDDGCQVRRLTDGSVLPRVFPLHELRGTTASGWDARARDDARA